MKLNRTKLRRLILEELKRLSESASTPDAAVLSRFNLVPELALNYNEVYEKFGRKAVLIPVSIDDAAVIDNSDNFEFALENFINDELKPRAVKMGLSSSTSDIDASYHLEGRILKAVQLVGDEIIE